MHTRPTERPFYCITGDLTGEGLLVVVDESTHELVVREGAEAGTKSVIVNPKGAQAKGPRGGAIGAPRARVNREVAEAARDGLESFYRRRRGEALYALTLRPDGSGTLMVFDGGAVASAELSDPMVEQLIEQLRGRDRGSNGRVLPESGD